MPAGDRSGPMGMGPRTGRGMGYCGSSDAPGWASDGPDRGFYGRRGPGMPRGQGRGRGRGTGRGNWTGMAAGRGPGGMRRRNWYHATGLPRWARQGVTPPWASDAAYAAVYDAAPSQEQEVEMLKEEAVWLEEQLGAIQARMDELSQA